MDRSPLPARLFVELRQHPGKWLTPRRRHGLPMPDHQTSRFCPLLSLTGRRERHTIVLSGQPSMPRQERHFESHTPHSHPLPRLVRSSVVVYAMPRAVPGSAGSQSGAILVILRRICPECRSRGQVRRGGGDVPIDAAWSSTVGTTTPVHSAQCRCYRQRTCGRLWLQGRGA